MKIEIGDRIVFKAATRWNCGTVTRMVVGFYDFEEKIPTVRYGGWGDFAVALHEIKKVIKRKKENVERT